MPQAPRLAPGSIFARDFKVIDLLAEGGMGAVYRAEQLSTRKLRALKLVSHRLASDPKGRQRFVREATVGASINSAHVVEVIGAGIDEDTRRPWLAMELLDGADLGAVVRHQGPLSPGQLHEVISQLCHGLAAAHRAGIVHRDLKPANIFIARSRRAGVPFTVKILDFGIAKVVQESGTGGTETDTVGSPLWMAPEQLNAQRPVPATDVWALGLLAFWALTAKHYWVAAHSPSSTVQALFVEQLFKELVTPTQRAAELSADTAIIEGFDAWFSRCIDRDPAGRYTDARQAGDALLDLLSADPRGAARLLPREELLPSAQPTQPATPQGSETTVAAGATGWEASAVVSAAEVAAARSSAEGDATRVDPAPLGADLSVEPLPGQQTRRAPRPGVSPWVVLISVVAVVMAVAGGGYAAWRWQGSRTDMPQTAKRSSAPEDRLARLEGSTSTSGASASGAGTDETTAADSATTGTTGGATTEAATDSADPSPPNLALAPVVPMRTQLPARAHDVQLLGWSRSGHRFVLRVDHRDEHGEQSERLSLVQVHDALTSAMIESFVLSHDAPPQGGRSKLGRAASEAGTASDWAARRASLDLDKRAPTGRGPREGRLRISADDPPEGTTLSFPPSRLGVAFRWSGMDAIAQTGSGRQAPRVTIGYEVDDQRWDLHKMSVPFTVRELLATVDPEGEPPALVGRVMAYWSPDETQVLLLLEADGRPTTAGGVRQRAWALRGVGPQVRLLEAGCGQRRAREVAARLVTAGIPVATVDLREPEAAQSKIVAVRGHEGADATAAQIGAVLDELTAPERKRRRGSADVVVVLGHDVE